MTIDRGDRRFRGRRAANRSRRNQRKRRCYATGQGDRSDNRSQQEDRRHFESYQVISEEVARERRDRSKIGRDCTNFADFRCVDDDHSEFGDQRSGRDRAE